MSDRRPQGYHPGACTCVDCNTRRRGGTRPRGAYYEQEFQAARAREMEMPPIMCEECGYAIPGREWRVHQHNADRVNCEAPRCPARADGYLMTNDSPLCGPHLLDSWRAKRPVRIVIGAICGVCSGLGNVHADARKDLRHRWVQCPHCRGTGYDAKPPGRRRAPIQERPEPPPAIDADALLREAIAGQPAPRARPFGPSPNRSAAERSVVPVPRRPRRRWRPIVVTLGLVVVAGIVGVLLYGVWYHDQYNEWPWLSRLLES